MDIPDCCWLNAGTEPNGSGNPCWLGPELELVEAAELFCPAVDDENPLKLSSLFGHGEATVCTGLVPVVGHGLVFN